MLSTLINLLFLVLLAVVMGYGVLLSRRVNRLMAALAELGPAVKAFSDAVEKSEQSVTAMKAAAVEAGQGVAREAEALRESAAAAAFTSIRRQPIAGMTRLTGKSELVKSFFERGRAVETARQW
ncbi:flagellar motor switch protein [Solirhodobacter olei]|uniref:flagellar motor switch protein n=1 Tax=Solirhodobacter olei TaxID=2493082 RepID=UPI000FD9E934|nr:flagellar motor switch protein [Solirhodobacter olei]